MTPIPNMSIFFKMAAAAILFIMDNLQKLITQSEIAREQAYQIWMQSNQRFISYRAHKLFGPPSWKMEVFGTEPKNIWVDLPCVIYVKNKDNLSVNILVRAKLRIRPRRRRRKNAKHYKHPDIHGVCLIIFKIGWPIRLYKVGNFLFTIT